MVDELIDILDANGYKTGHICLKSIAHQKGYWHTCIHVWLYDGNGNVVIQKRIESKDTFPDKWDVSVAGHVGAGENLLVAAQRETFEELGLKVRINELEWIGNYATDIKHDENLIDREYHHIYIVELTKPIEELVLQATEVSEIKLISISELKKNLNSKNKQLEFVPYDLYYFDLVFDAIQNKR